MKSSKQEIYTDYEQKSIQMDDILKLVERFIREKQEKKEWIAGKD